MLLAVLSASAMSPAFARAPAMELSAKPRRPRLVMLLAVLSASEVSPASACASAMSLRA